MYKIGIECESIEEGQQWGVGRIVSKLLEEISKRPELAQEFRFFLYFKSKIPDYPYLDNNIFVKKILTPSFLPKSFSLYYYILLPIKLWFDRPSIMYFPANMLPLIFVGKSIVTLTEDLYYEMTKGSLPFRYKLAYNIFSRWAAKHATRVVAVSQASKSEISKLFKIKHGRIAVIPNAVDFRGVIDKNSIGDYVLYIGQAFPRRHLKETILAFEKLHSEFPNLKLFAIGKDAYNPPIIEDLVKQTNQRMGSDFIISKTYVSQEEIERLYSDAMAVGYGSDSEAFGLPPLEALAYGTVSIVASLPTSREIFSDKAFFVVDPISVDSIASAIKDALTNDVKRNEIINNAPNILKHYTWQKHTDRFFEIIKEMTNE